MKKMVIVLLVVVGISGGLGFWYWKAHAGPNTAYRVVPVEKAPFLATIAATGTVQPEEVIDVGAQVNGRIERFGLDLQKSDIQVILAVIGGWPRADAGGLLLSGLIALKPTDYLSAVENGTILAQLDARLFQAEVDKAAANLE